VGLQQSLLDENWGGIVVLAKREWRILLISLSAVSAKKIRYPHSLALFRDNQMNE